MKENRFIFLAFLVTMFISSSSHANSIEELTAFDPSPYVGADAQLRFMRFKKDYGQNEFREKYYAQGNAFVGLKLNPYFGLEFGYFKAKDAKSLSVGSTDVLLGVRLDPTEPQDIIISNNKVKLHGMNLNVVGFWPLDECNDFIAAVGVNRTWVRLEHQPIVDGFGILPQQNQADDRREFFAKKSTIQIKAGVQHYFTECFSLRTLIAWENTNRFKGLRPTAPNEDSRLRAFLRSSYTLSAGLVYNFW